MKKLIGCLAIAGSALAGTNAMAGVTFYELENFSGRSFVADGTVPNFVTRGFNDLARSAVVEGAPVEVCLNIDFGGGCTVLNPGRYPTLGDLSAKISSARPLGAPQGPVAAGVGRVTFYEAENFGGRPFVTDGAVPTFVTRGSCLFAQTGPDSFSASSCIERYLIILKCFSSLPTRSCV